MTKGNPYGCLICDIRCSGTKDQTSYIKHRTSYIKKKQDYEHQT